MPRSNPDSIEIKLADGSIVEVRNFAAFILIRTTHEALGQLGRAIFERKFEFVDEVIATEVEICLEVNDRFTPELLSQLSDLEFAPSEMVSGKALAAGTERDEPAASALPLTRRTQHEIRICITEDHEDWPLIEAHTGLQRDQYVEELLQCRLSVAMTGFLPGFVYLKGLPEALQVPRKNSPSVRTLPNTFAIGGKYAGIYSLPSAAGWNCIGRLEQSIFDPNQLPPVALEIGDQIELIRTEKLQETSVPAPTATTSTTKDMGALRFRKPGMLTTIQDQGREGMAYYAVPKSGPMDVMSASIANALVGNPNHAPVIECNFVGPEIEFGSDATICLTGADMGWQVDGKPTHRNKTIKVRAGSMLRGSAAVEGCRAYIAIRGEIETTKTLGSSSCYAPAGFGGNNGKPFSTGDQLRWIKPTEQAAHLDLEIQLKSGCEGLLIEAGPEFDWLDAKSVEAIYASEFSVNPTSNRMGARLDGPKLSTRGQQLEDSLPLLPGMIQLTPEGQCIVVLQDGQTTGGYPRIAFLNERNVQRLSQTKIGHPFRLRMAE